MSNVGQRVTSGLLVGGTGAVGVVGARQRTTTAPVGRWVVRCAENIEAHGKHYEDREQKHRDPENLTLPLKHLEVLQHRYSNQHT